MLRVPAGARPSEALSLLDIGVVSEAPTEQIPPVAMLQTNKSELIKIVQILQGVRVIKFQNKEVFGDKHQLMVAGEHASQ